MKFFKYFILIFISFYSTFLFAEEACYNYRIKNSYLDTGLQKTPEETCKALVGKNTASGIITKGVLKGDICYIDGKGFTDSAYNRPERVSIECGLKCPETGTPQTVFFPKDGLTPTRVCTGPVNGQYCSYSNSNPQVYPYAVRNMVILRSDSDKPVSTCTDAFSGSKCDPKDPYGECYQPPDDKCVRASNGSILCPDDAPPPKVESGCQGGATYCKRPPSGCGSDYVSGTLNNQAVCVKKGGDSTGGSNTGSNNGSTDTTQNSDGSTTSVNKDANGNPTQTTVTNKDGSSSTTNINKDGSSNTVNRDPNGNVTGTSSGNTSSSSNGNGTTITINNNDGSTTIITSDKTNNQTQTSHTPPGGTGQPNTTGGTTIIQKNEVDLSGVIAAINAVVDKLKWLKEELGYSIAEIGKKIDGTNEKLDSLNNKTDNTNKKIDESNQNLKDIKNVLDEIKNKPDSSNPSSSPIGDGEQSDLSGIESKLGEIRDFLLADTPEKEDGKVLFNEIEKPNESENAIRFNAVCPAPISENISIIGYSWTYSFSFDSYCQVLAKLSNYFVFIAYLGAAFIISGVRDA